MRAKEFIVEYDQTKTIQAYGQKLIQSLLSDKGNLPSELSQSRFAIQSGETTDQLNQKAIGGILQSLESADPTGKKAYTLWLVKCYAEQKIKLEDILSKGKDWLSIYIQLKQKNALPPEYSNINKLSFGQLGDVSTNSELLAKLGAKKEVEVDRGQFETILNNSEVRIIHPLDETAAKYYGRGTRWCTAGDSGNMFNHYNRTGPMFILLPKSPKYDGEKYQIHFSTDQFMDEGDDPVNILDLLTKRFGDIMEVIKEADSAVKTSYSLLFADDAVLEKLLGDMHDVALAHVDKILSEWEHEDDDYYSYLQDEGFMDEDGDIDWDRAPPYSDYNSEYEQASREMNNAIDITPKEFKEHISEYISEYIDECESDGHEPDLRLTNAEFLFSYIVSKECGRNGSDFAEWIREKMYINPDLSVHVAR